jgi:CheY-like chemotaxis protein
MKALNGKKILVVDDEVDLCEMLADELNFSGATTYQAHSGNQALEFLKSHQVDAIVSDINMPNGNGIELLKKLRQSSNTSAVVLLMTGYSDYTPSEIYEAGAEGIMSKPLELEIFTSEIQRLLTPVSERLRDLRYQLPANYDVKVKLGDSKESWSLKLVNIARGGAFISNTDNEFPKLDQALKFSLEIVSPENNFFVFEGVGVCRWIRKSATEKSSSGFGIEFFHLTFESHNFLMKMLDKLKTTVYIPTS